MNVITPNPDRLTQDEIYDLLIRPLSQRSTLLQVETFTALGLPLVIPPLAQRD